MNNPFSVINDAVLEKRPTKMTREERLLMDYLAVIDELQELKAKVGEPPHLCQHCGHPILA
jgi:hypothetical protein